MRCAPYPVESNGEIQAPSPFQQSTSIKDRCDREGAIVAALKPVLKLDKKQMLAMRPELDRRLNKLKECLQIPVPTQAQIDKKLGMVKDCLEQLSKPVGQVEMSVVLSGMKECIAQRAKSEEEPECRIARTSDYLSQISHFEDQNGWRWRVTRKIQFDVSPPLKPDWPYAKGGETYTESDYGPTAMPEYVGPISVLVDASGQVATARKSHTSLAGEALKELSNRPPSGWPTQ
jgi:hypothetical protein